ncbi:MAG: hypothetical protein ACFFEE_09780, partial [Candidatus Thorarchaeota archaeon]
CLLNHRRMTITERATPDVPTIRMTGEYQDRNSDHGTFGSNGSYPFTCSHQFGMLSPSSSLMSRRMNTKPSLVPAISADALEIQPHSEIQISKSKAGCNSIQFSKKRNPQKTDEMASYFNFSHTECYSISLQNIFVINSSFVAIVIAYFDFPEMNIHY